MGLRPDPRRAVAAFILLSYALGYGLVFLLVALSFDFSGPQGAIVAAVYMFTPFVAALVVQRFFLREPLFRNLGIRFRFNRWYLVAVVAPIILALLALAVAMAFPGVDYSPTGRGIERYTTLTPDAAAIYEDPPIPLIPLIIASGVFAGVTVNALFSFGEELGWRGLLQRLVGHWGFWRSSAFIGLVWGLWHAPLILQGHNYPQHPTFGVLMMVVFTVLIAPLFSYVRLRARSVLAAAVLHGVLNGTVGLSIIMAAGGSDLTVGLTGLAGFIVLAAANVAIFAHDRWSRAWSVDAILKRAPQEAP